jgi:hypothetical protein
MSTSKINASLSDVMRLTHVGDNKSALANALYGINHRMTAGPVPVNKDYEGYVFFTRPQLNFTEQNLRADRRYIPLLTTEPVSIQRMIRKLLDPRLYSMPCPFVDDQSIFLPILSNSLMSLSGFPDPYINSYISREGLQKESFGFVDDTSDLYHNYKINATFKNIVGNPLVSLFYLWTEYTTNVFKGTMLPYPDMIAYREIDYNTRIWRLIMDQNHRFVTHIGCCGAAYPVNAPFGALFDYQHDRPLNTNLDTINITFECFGAQYDDPILVHEFNKAVAIMHTGMRPKPEGDDWLPGGDVVRIQPQDLQWLNHRGYPWIHPETMELFWYLDREVYQSEIEERDRVLEAITPARR